MSCNLLEKLPVLTLTERFPELEKAGHPYNVAFEVVTNLAYEHHPETFDVYMHNDHETLQIDTVPSLCVEGQTVEIKAAFLKAAYTEACHDLSVTFQEASEKPMQMAGWTVEGGERRFILKHRGEREVLRNMAYVAGLDAHDLLGMAPHHYGDTSRALMIFKY